MQRSYGSQAPSLILSVHRVFGANDNYAKGAGSTVWEQARWEEIADNHFSRYGWPMHNIAYKGGTMLYSSEVNEFGRYNELL